MEKITSGKLAALAEVNIESIRFYERKGLMPKPDRSDSGYRLYSNDDVHRIKFIKKAQKIGFTLKEIKELLNLRVDENFSCSDVQVLINKKINEMNERINEMTAINRVLKDMLGLCRTNSLQMDCPFLDLLNRD